MPELHAAQLLHRSIPILIGPNLWRWWLAICALWIMGCAQPTVQTPLEDGPWNGRIALQVEGQATQSFSAMFELRGTPQTGALVLLSPFGNRVAQLDWRDGHAQLLNGQEIRTSDSLEVLLQEVTGTHIPVAALFSWLKGMQASATGWQADLSDIEQGRLTARRDNPAPPATLRIALTR